MKKIGFLYILAEKHGGTIYRERVAEALSTYCDVEINRVGPAYFFRNKYLKFLGSAINFLKFKGCKDIWIRDFFSTCFFTKKTKGKNISLIFHIDFPAFAFPANIIFFLLEKLFFYRNLKIFTAIVVICEYWKNFFEKKGYKNVHKIYCGFDLNNFCISEAQAAEFKEKYGLGKKPIIYLGNCQKIKGVIDSYMALQGLDVQFVTSGKKEVDIPALNFNLSYQEYLKLLKASDIVLTMSKMKEGWCITAHEAMLLKTPVIGSGKGGMKELLEGGGQIICENFENLREKVEYLLINPGKREELGNSGFNFAKNFTLEKFELEWKNLIEKIN